MPRTGSTTTETVPPAETVKVSSGFAWRTGKGVVVLTAAALIGAMTRLGAISMVAGPAQVPFLPAFFMSLCQSIGVAPPSDEASFLTENEGAMTRMMRAMDITPTGEIDHDFVEIMVPHHQGAIDMAVAVLRHGRNERLRRLAQEIIVTQQQEIAAMRLALRESVPPPVAPSAELQTSPPGGRAVSRDPK